MKVKITAETSCDLSRALAEQYGIALVPIHVILSGKSYRDVYEIGPFEMFAAVEKENLIPTTSAPSENDYFELFSSLHDEEYAIVHISTTSEHSVCYANAVSAARKVGAVWVVDSRNATTGAGLLALRGAELAQAGYSAAEIVERLTRATEQVETSCVLDSVAYMRRGGRISAVAAKGVELLRLKPCIEMRDGRLGVGKKYRGRLDNVLPAYVRDRLFGRTDIDLKRVFITNSLYDKAILRKIRELVKSLQPFEEILETDAGCAISCHSGPNALGVLFLRKG